MLALVLALQIPSGQAKTIYAQLRETVYEVERLAQSGWERGGTAFIVTHGNYQYVVTCEHVVSASEPVLKDGKITEVPYKGFRVKQGAFIKDVKFVAMKDQDIAAAKFSGAKKTARISQLQPMIGDKVYAMGFPASEFLTISEGIVNRLSNVFGHAHIGHSADLYFGNSGGPLFNESGDVVGVNNLMHGGARHLYYSEPTGEGFRKFLQGL
jgi:serine protease Do